MNSTSRLILAGCILLTLSVGYFCGRQSLSPSPKKAFKVDGDSMWPTLADGDQCQVTTADQLFIGDVVAIHWAGKKRVKRVAGLGGDEINLENGRLRVNSERLEDLIARRHDRDFLPPSLVLVSDQESDWQPIPNSFSKLFRHRNPHAGGTETSVMDDYPINESVQRILHPVDRLVVRNNQLTPFEVDVFFRIEARILKAPLLGGIARVRDAVPTEESISFGDHTQIAVRTPNTDPMATRFHVMREIEYRDDRPSGEVSYPITLGQRDVFVVGDNVPVSVDSRTFGPITREAVIGTIQRLPPNHSSPTHSGP